MKQPAQHDMDRPRVKQIVAYVDTELFAALDAGRKLYPHRISMSGYVEMVLRRQLDRRRKRRAAAGTSA